MKLNERITAFCKLGQEIQNVLLQDDDLLQKIYNSNNWYTVESQKQALSGIAGWLTEEQLTSWTSNYNMGESKKTVALITASNIPLVGFHDILAVLISGHQLKIKISKEDPVLTRYVLKMLVDVAPEMKDSIEVVDGMVKDFDAAICTGSTNTSRYFEQYFGKYPNIIRKNRGSVAVLSGEESTDELASLGKDIFQYFGMGCRNISKLYVPKDYKFDAFFEAIYDENDIIHHNKYYNNYNYNKTIYLMNQDELLDNGFVILKEATAVSSPIGVINYERYESPETVVESIVSNKEAIQCVVSKNDIPFGGAQQPGLSDYADGVDTLAFLTDL